METVRTGPGPLGTGTTDRYRSEAEIGFTAPAVKLVAYWLVVANDVIMRRYILAAHMNREFKGGLGDVKS